MSQKLVINKELVEVKGHVKAIVVKKEDFHKFLQPRKLRILDKEYEVLMPSLEDMKKNTIDVNGLAVLMTQYLSTIITNSGNTNPTTPAQMVLTTPGGTTTLTYSGSVSPNTQGVSVYMQLFQASGNYTWQYYFVGFDTTNASYTTSQIELFASANASHGTYGDVPSPFIYYTDIVRIAYTNASFTKTSDSYLFIVWLIQFQNIPTYAILFVPTFQNNAGIATSVIQHDSKYTVYVNNGNCTFTCSGNCPSGSLTGFVTYVQDNSIISEIPVMIAIGAGTPTTEILICSSIIYYILNVGSFTISSNFSTTLSPPVSGSPFYIALATITIVYQTS